MGSPGGGWELGTDRAAPAAAMAGLMAVDRSAEADHVAGVDMAVEVAPGLVASDYALSASGPTVGAAPARDGDAMGKAFGTVEAGELTALDVMADLLPAAEGALFSGGEFHPPCDPPNAHRLRRRLWLSDDAPTQAATLGCGRMAAVALGRPVAGG